MMKALAAAFILTACSGVLSAQPASIPLVLFPEETRDFSSWIRDEGWKIMREQPRDWGVGGGALHLVSRGNSVLMGIERGLPVDLERTPILRLRLKVVSVPRGTDLSRKSGDDAAFRAYLAFDKGGGFFTPPHTIAYTWSEKEAAGTVIASPHYSNVHYISLGLGPTPGDEWVVVERDVVADYRALFPGEARAPVLNGLALKCDTNDTKTFAESRLSVIELRGR
ncbi:MAG: DUF3047 domain-containing protein [Elusimicrobiota bacterium]